MVDVEVKQGERLLVPLAACQRVRQTVLEQPPVGQPGQAVVMGLHHAF